MGLTPEDRQNLKGLGKARKAARKANEKEARKAGKKLYGEAKKQAQRAKYGPSRMPAPLIIRSLETGEVLEIKDPQRKRPSPKMKKKIEKARHDEERRRELEEKAAWLDESLDLGLDRDSS